MNNQLLLSNATRVCGFSSTRNIANGGGCSNLEHFCPASSFVTVDRNDARKPPLAILPNVSVHA